jgi:hypothetical protein
VVQTVRLTAQEVGALTARFGSAGKGLRVLVDQWLSETPRPRRQEVGQIPDDLVAVALEMMDAPDAATARAIADATPHRHRRGEVIRVDYENGTAKKVYACATCQEELA